MDANWARWIKSSVVQYFTTALSGLSLYIEGRERPNPAPTKLIELRVDGPTGKELSHNYWKLSIEINVLISCTRDSSDAYATERLIGAVQAAFAQTITVKKYGDTSPGDYLGCLSRRDDGREGIITSEFGLIDASQGLRQATVEGHYMMELRK